MPKIHRQMTDISAVIRKYPPLYPFRSSAFLQYQFRFFIIVHDFIKNSLLRKKALFRAPLPLHNYDNTHKISNRDP